VARVLLVDDEPDVLNKYRKFIEGAGHEVLGSNYAWEALEKFRRNGADIVITGICSADYDPPMGVFDFVREIKKIAPQVPIIVFTEYKDWNDYFEKGQISQFIRKNREDDLLLKAIEKEYSN
jgi:two-component system, cell cycle sensor histidine kinase and response regulator CckA